MLSARIRLARSRERSSIMPASLAGSIASGAELQPASPRVAVTVTGSPFGGVKAISSFSA